MVGFRPMIVEAIGLAQASRATFRTAGKRL
jgi:hypothetical protein